MKEIWVNKAKSSKSAEKFDFEYDLRKSPAQRLEIMQF